MGIYRLWILTVGQMNLKRTSLIPEIPETFGERYHGLTIYGRQWDCQVHRSIGLYSV